MSQSPPQTLTLNDDSPQTLDAAAIEQSQTQDEPIEPQPTEDPQTLDESAAEANNEAELRELGEEIKLEDEKREEQRVPQADGVDGPSIHPPKAPRRRSKPVSAAQQAFAERKLALLQGNFNPIPFSPNITLDFSAHEELFRALNLWEFVNLDLSEEIRSDLLILLIANYDRSERRSFVWNVEISVARPDLARALKLPVENESGKGGQDLFLRSESKEVIEEFLSNYILLEDEDDMCILPEAVVVASQLVKAGRANKVDWAGLMWVLVEKELSEVVPMLRSNHYASHLQCLMKFQQPGLFEIDAGAEAVLVPEPESSMEVSDSSMDEEDEYEDEDGCGMDMRGIEEFENGGFERRGPDLGLGLGMGENGGLMDGTEDCKGSEEGDWVDDGNDMTIEHCLRRCNSVGVRGMEYENLCKEEQVEREEEFSNFGRLNSTGLLHAMEAETVQGSFCPRMNPRNQDTGDFVSMGVDGSKNMPVDTGPGSSLIFENNGKRHINSVDINEEEIGQFHQNNQQKRMRCGGIWEEQVPSGFDSYMEQIQCTIGKAKMLYTEKEQACLDAHLQLQCLNQILEQKDQFIRDLEKTRVEEHQRWQHTGQRYQQELNTVANLVVNYKKALKQLQSKFQDYRMKCPQGDEPFYKDVGGASGLVVTLRECERLRLEKEEEMRRTAEEVVNCFECDWFRKFEEYNNEVVLLHRKLVELEVEVKFIKESYAECMSMDI